MQLGHVVDDDARDVRALVARVVGDAQTATWIRSSSKLVMAPIVAANV